MEAHPTDPLGLAAVLHAAPWAPVGRPALARAARLLSPDGLRQLARELHRLRQMGVVERVRVGGEWRYSLAGVN